MTAHYTSLHAAIKMLQSRLGALHALLTTMSNGMFDAPVSRTTFKTVD